MTQRSSAVHESVALPFEIEATEIVSSDDPRAKSPEMRRAVMNEVRDLLKQGTFKVMLKEELPDGANALTARFVLAIKSNADSAIKFKARYVIGGHRDQLKHYMVNGAQTLQCSSARLNIALESMCEFDVWSTDVELAYLQSSEPLERRVFIKSPAQELELEPNECFDLLKPLYGLCVAVDLWHETLRKHLTNDLHLIQTKEDPSLCFSFDEDDELEGINGPYVDELILAGKEKFEEKCKKTHELFEITGDEDIPFDFSGFNIRKGNYFPLKMNQTSYAKQLQVLDHNSTFPNFRSMRMKLAWLANTRPDLLFDIS